MKWVQSIHVRVLATAVVLAGLCACNILVETRNRPDLCGDGLVEHWEACDGVNLNGATCETVDGSHGVLRCTGACGFDMTLCGGGPECGNGVRNAGESCDGTDLGTDTCVTQGYLEDGELKCHLNCTFDVSSCLGAYGFCGNGVWDEGEGEACENGEEDPGCTSTCVTEPGWTCENTDGTPSVCTPTCGDAQLVGDEPCDGTLIREGLACESTGHYPGTLACLAETCTLDFTGCTGSCGDGVLQASEEECEGAEGGGDCADWGFSAGPLGCATCRLDFAGCSPEVPPGAFERLSVGGAHTCGVRETKVYCWGSNDRGQLGADTGGAFRPTPVEVVFAEPQVAIDVTAGESHTCALMNTGVIFCWGNNQYGQLGNGGTTSGFSPTQVSTTFSASVVGAGANHTCALLSVSGQIKVFCWGDNQYSQLGVVSPAESALPVAVPSVETDVFETLAVGADHTCAGTHFTSKKIFCWGRNDAGQLGIGSAEPFVNAVSQVIDLEGTNELQLTAGAGHTCARVNLEDQQKLYCWGANEHGQLGNGGTDASGLPVQVTSLLGAAGGLLMSVGAGLRNTCAVIDYDSYTELYCWGSNEFGQLAVDQEGDALSPLLLTALPGVEAVTLHQDHVCAISRPVDGYLAYCWGRNDHGQLGDQTRTDAFAPVLVGGQNPSK